MLFRSVLDPEIEKGTNTEEVPTRVSISLADGRTFIERVAHPRGSPHRRMTWDELSALFIDSVGDALRPHTIDNVLDLVSRLDSDGRPRKLVRSFVAVSGWLGRDD